MSNNGKVPAEKSDTFLRTIYKFMKRISKNLDNEKLEFLNEIVIKIQEK